MNSEPTIGSMIKFSWEKSRELLFPFKFNRWFRILMIVWLAGVGVQGVSANFKIPSKEGTSPAEKFFKKYSNVRPFPAVKKMPPTLPSTAPEPAGVSALLADQGARPAPQKRIEQPVPNSNAARMMTLRSKMERPRAQGSLLQIILFLTGTVVFGLGSMAFFLWFSSRFNFVLLDSLVGGSATIPASFREHRESGNSYFRWSLGFVGIIFAAFLVLVLIVVGLWALLKGNLVLSVPVWGFAGLLALAILLVAIFFGAVMRDFVLPVMYREKIPAMSAMNKFFRAGAFAFGKVFQYLLIVFGFWVLAVVLQTIVGVLVLIGGVIAGGMVAIPGIILVKALPLLKFPMIFLGGLVALLLIFAVVAVTGMVMLPVVIFFRVFALAYLTRLYPDCDLLNCRRGA